MRRREFLIGGALAASIRAADNGSTTWILENDRIAITYAWSGEGSFHLVSLLDKRTTRVWRVPETSPGVLRLGGNGGLTIGPGTIYALPSVSQEEVGNGGRRLTFRLQPQEVDGEIFLEAEVYPDRPFLRQRWLFKNLSSRAVTLTSSCSTPNSV